MSMLAITRDERDVLRREIDWISGALEDLTNCFKRGSFDARLRYQVHIGLALADDLGWQFEDPRDEFYLTLPERELAHWLREQIEQNRLWAEEQRQALGEARTNAVHDRNLMVQCGEKSPPTLMQLEADIRDTASRALDEALDMIAVGTALLGRLGDC